MMLTCIKHGLLLLLVMLILTTVVNAVPQTGTHETIPVSQSSQDNLLKMEKAGISNADFYNQLGLSYYKQGRIGKAVICFLRALRLNSSHPESRNNLDYVLNLTMDKEMYNQPSFLPSIFQKAFDFFSLNALALIVLALLLITILCFHWLLYLGVEQDKAVPVMWLVIFGFILLFAGTMLAMKYRGFLDSTKAVVMVPVVEGFSGPGSEYGNLFNIHEGLIVHINRMDKDWALITLPNGGAGWIQANFLERVRP